MNKPLTLPECRDKVAQDLGYEDWKELRADQSTFTDAGFDLIVNNVAKLNAEEKVKEMAQLAAERTNYPYRDEYGCACNVPYIVLNCSEELINKIKKEI